MDSKLLIDILKSNPGVQFIGCGITYLQLYGVNAAFEYLREKWDVKDGIFLSAPHATTGRVIYKDIFLNENLKYHTIDSMYFDHVYGMFKDRILAYKLIRRNEPTNLIYIASSSINYKWVNMINVAFPDKNIVFIVIDDGGGSYLNKTKDTLRTIMYENTELSLIRKNAIIAKNIADGFYNRIFTKRLSKNRQLVDFRLFRWNSNGCLERNNRAIPYYINELKRRTKGVEKGVKEVFEDNYLINTQCLVENMITDGVVDLKIYSEVVNIVNNIGKKVILKPHPREIKIEKYGQLKCEIYSDNRHSQEIILASLDKPPKCIISIFSSTLLNAYGLFDIPAISLAKIVVKENINNVFRNQLEEFIEQYKNIFFFPETYMDLEIILNKLK